MLNRNLPPIEELNVILWSKWIGPYEHPLENWMRRGPDEPYMHTHPWSVISKDGRKFSTRIIPLRFRNDWLARPLIRWGFLPEPWPDYIVRLQRFNEETKKAIRKLDELQNQKKRKDRNP